MACALQIQDAIAKGKLKICEVSDETILFPRDEPNSICKL
jgi:hypothetical protein